jgi:hypothetical protein
LLDPAVGARRPPRFPSGQFRGFSERKLIDCLTSLGREVQIVVKQAPQRRAGGKLTIIFA